MAIDKDKGTLTLDRVTDWWESEITEIAPNTIRVRGYAIEDLIASVSFPAMIWLTLRGELPSQVEERLLNAVLVSSVDHGPQAPSIAMARMTATCGVGLNSAMANGINALGDVHGGAGQQCMELLLDTDARHRSGTPLDISVLEALEKFRAKHGAFISGFGHRFHAIDPRAVKLSELLRDAMKGGHVTGQFLAIGEAIQKELGRNKSRPPAMNVDGVIAVVLAELGFPPELARGVFILSRSVGICAHAHEQMQQGQRLKGPMPPEAGFRFRGVPPRALPAKDTK